MLLRSAFLVVLFIMFYMVIITFAESEDETLKCDHSNESYWTVLPVVLFIALYRVVLTFESEDVAVKSDNSNEQYSPAVLFIMLKKAILTFESIERWTLKRVHLNESYWAALSCRGNLNRGTVECRNSEMARLKN